MVCNDILEEGVRFQRELKKVSDFNAHENPRVAVLDMASDLHPGGSYSTGSTSQEEDMCRRNEISLFSLMEIELIF